MSDYNVRTEAWSTAASNISDALQDDIDTSSSIPDQIQSALDAGSFSAPDIIYYHQSWDVVCDSGSPEPYEKPDFSGCDNARDCVQLEANMIMESAYGEAVQSLCENIGDALEDVAAKTSIADWTPGGAGLDHLPHLREFDAGDGNVCHWHVDGRDIYELTIERVKFHARAEEEDEDGTSEE